MIILGDIITALSENDRFMSQKINTSVEDQNALIKQQNVIDTYRTLYPITKCTFFVSAYRIFTKIVHTWAIKQTSINLEA